MNLHEKFYNDILTSPLLLEKIHNDAFASELYSALTNVTWKMIYSDSEDEVADILAGKDGCSSMSFRSAGHIIAEMRNTRWGTNEDYMDWYCCAPEGIVSNRIANVMYRIGWNAVRFDP
jgi:hypothetical protein